MIELADTGYENIVCTQPFGCLPNHINGKGAIRKIKEIRPNANIVTIDYDPGAPKVNQENRIKLMLAVGKEELKKSLRLKKMAKKPNRQRSQRKSNLISMLMSHRRWRWLFYFAVISGRKS